MGRERVAKAVRRRGGVDAAGDRPALDHPLDRARRQALALRVDEQCRAGRAELAPHREVLLQGRVRLIDERALARLVALAVADEDDRRRVAAGLEIRDVEPARFRDAQAGRVDEVHPRRDAAPQQVVALLLLARQRAVAGPSRLQRNLDEVDGLVEDERAYSAKTIEVY